MAADAILQMKPSGGRRLAGTIGLAFIAMVLLAPFLALPLATGARPALAVVAADPYVHGVLRFTLMQAGLSALLSAVFALPLALAMHRRAFPGRQLILRVLLLPQALPTLVAALGILAVFGRSGLVSSVLAAAGIGRLDIYGLTGILIAHVFFNMPLATRLMLAALSAIPAESWKLAGQLSMGRRATFRLVEWPAIRASLPGILTLVFMLCVTSFAVVLVLGGGPSATTLEVAIYQALRYDFDPARVTALSLLQIVVVSLVLAVSSALGRSDGGIASLGGRARRYDRDGPAARVVDTALIVTGLAFILAPFGAILWNGLASDLRALALQPAVQQALVTSLAIAVSATAMGLALSLALALGRRGRRRGLVDYAGSVVLVVPPIVVGAGWFLILREFAAVASLAPLVVVTANAVMAVPFMLRVLTPAMDRAEAQRARLAAHLGIRGWAYWRLVLWPALRRPLGLALAFGLSLSLGDLGVVALFGSQDLVTLPYLLLQRMGSYRTADAAGIALILAATCLTLMWLAERGAQTDRTP
ncbi:thiamine/thiamine pyrophosphate ABC transporter permease [Aureimonas altamirensis]|uniref:thiamine/thiamine pyrophosphate ABC transporter permease n=1 Tax=Aureimonas altamirensis TaxID=370622 RepID=UPI0025574234|nr:thiamine/thiamine pyrophosphate ABC transporter permease [Aureimonas altamirensis]